jgi:DNA-binding response OmpR family regulator
VLPGKRILVVDDETQFAENLRDYFSRRKAEVVVLDSGEAALEAAGRLSPDVVIVADRLPAMDGAQTCEALKARLPPFHCVLLTDRSEDLPAAAREAGVDQVLEKPFPLADLERIVSAGSACGWCAAGCASRATTETESASRTPPRLRVVWPPGDRWSRGATV